MITFRVVTHDGTKDMKFENHDEGNTWAAKLYVVLKRGNFIPRRVDKSTCTIHSELSFRELHDLGISFFHAVQPVHESLVKKA